jgi:hypothetical protein
MWENPVPPPPTPTTGGGGYYNDEAYKIKERRDKIIKREDDEILGILKMWFKIK